MLLYAKTDEGVTPNQKYRMSGNRIDVKTLDLNQDFELLKSNTCHSLKEDIRFLIELQEEDSIRRYYRKKWFPECFYLLAILDYVSRINEIQKTLKAKL